MYLYVYTLGTAIILNSIAILIINKNLKTIFKNYQIHIELYHSPTINDIKKAIKAIKRK